MKMQEWFESPPPQPRVKEQFFNYGNLYNPSPKYLLIKPPTNPDTTSTPNDPIDNQIPSLVKFEDQVINAYFIEFPKQTKKQLTPPTKIKMEEVNDITLSPVDTDNNMRSKKYRIRSTIEKIQIVKQAEVHGLNKVSRRYKVSVNNICRWRKRCERKIGAGRKVSDPEMEKGLVEWINSQTETLTKRSVRDQAKLLCANVNFKGSKGWFERLIIRHPHLKQKIEI